MYSGGSCRGGYSLVLLLGCAATMAISNAPSEWSASSAIGCDPLPWINTSDTASAPARVRGAMASTAIRAPENWAIRFAQAKIQGVRAVILDGMVGWGTGYAARAFYVVLPSSTKNGPSSLAWAAFSYLNLAAGEFQPAGTQAFTIERELCLDRTGALIYRDVRFDSSATALETMSGDELGRRPPGRYVWSSDGFTLVASNTP